MAADADGKSRHWKLTRLLAAVVLLMWAVAALAVPLFSSKLDRTGFLGFPLGYFMLTAGAPLVFLLLVLVSNWLQDAIDNGERG